MSKVKPLEKLDIVMSIFNQEKLIERVLGGIFKNTTTPFNLILVFDGCTDETQEIALAFIAKNKTPLLADLRTAIAPNVYETKANNIGFKMATEDYLITLQDDMEIEEKGWERRLTFPLRAYDDMFAVTSRTAHNILFPSPTETIPTYPNKAAREYFNLKRNRLELRSTINRGPIAFDRYHLVKLNFLDEDFAPAQFDEMDLVLRAAEQYGLKSGAFWIQYRSDLAWGASRSKNSTMNLSASFKKNTALLLKKHPQLASPKSFILETRVIKDTAIDYRSRDPLLLRAWKRLKSEGRYLHWQLRSKYSSVVWRWNRLIRKNT